MGGVDKHDKLWSTFLLEKGHKMKKYYVKLLLFLVDIALTNSWLLYKLVNEEKLQKGGESRADFFLSISRAMVSPDTDWEAKYKQRHGRNMRTCSNQGDCDDLDAYLPSRNVSRGASTTTINADVCQQCAFSIVPYQLSKESRNCQVCHYKMRREKWKGMVFCSKHGVRLCTDVRGPRNVSEPKLLQEDGSNVTGFSWACNYTGSCGTSTMIFMSHKNLTNDRI
jgi:RNA polymerase subunit RPABC4/transcription elongation factor Spt4